MEVSQRALCKGALQNLLKPLGALPSTLISVGKRVKCLGSFSKSPPYSSIVKPLNVPRNFSKLLYGGFVDHTPIICRKKRLQCIYVCMTSLGALQSSHLYGNLQSPSVCGLCEATPVCVEKKIETHVCMCVYAAAKGFTKTLLYGDTVKPLSIGVPESPSTGAL